MASYYLPVPPEGVGKWQCRVQIGSTFYRFLWKRNKRDGFWRVDFADDRGAALFRSRKICLGSDIFAPFRHMDIPQGTFDVVDTSNSHTEVTFENLGTVTQLRYTDP